MVLWWVSVQTPAGRGSASDAWAKAIADYATATWQTPLPVQTAREVLGDQGRLTWLGAYTDLAHIGRSALWAEPAWQALLRRSADESLLVPGSRRDVVLHPVAADARPVIGRADGGPLTLLLPSIGVGLGKIAAAEALAQRLADYSTATYQPVTPWGVYREVLGQHGRLWWVGGFNDLAHIERMLTAQQGDAGWAALVKEAADGGLFVPGSLHYTALRIF